jgi:type I protein arginine methyltransferase
MLQDNVRTSMYQAAILGNGHSMFKDKLVMDVGAGSGILSFFAVQAGASKVYAIEASGMADVR